TRSRSVTGPASTNFQPGSARPNRKNVWYAVDDSSAMVPPPAPAPPPGLRRRAGSRARKSTRLHSSHKTNSYAALCLPPSWPEPPACTHVPVPPPALHYFPTRRSSDLDAQSIRHGPGVHELPTRERTPQPQERLVRRGRLERDGAAPRPRPRSRPEPADGFAHQGMGVLLLFPAVQLGHDAVALDALPLERRADDGRRAHA